MKPLKLFALGLLMALPLSAVDYVEKIVPLWQQYCLDCHSAKDADGGLVMEDWQSLMKGGEEGKALIPGKAADSLLVKFLHGHSGRGGKYEFMPPGKQAKLKPEEVALIEAWINAGAPGPKTGELAMPKAREVKTKAVPAFAQLRPAVQSAAFSLKAGLLAVGRHGRVQWFEAQQTQPKAETTGLVGKVNALVFSPDGRRLYAAGGEPGIAGQVQVLDAASGKVLQSFVAHQDSVQSLALSADGLVLATGSYDQQSALWDAATGGRLRLLIGHHGSIEGLAFRPDGQVLASASADRTIKLWEVGRGQRLDTLSQPTREQYRVLFSADGGLLYAAGADNRVRKWAISKQALEGSNRLLDTRFAHEGSIVAMALSADGRLLVTSATDKTLKLWDASSLDEHAQLQSQPDWAAALCFEGNAALCVGRFDGSLQHYRAPFRP